MRKTSSLLLVSVILLVAVGIVVLASASSVQGQKRTGNPHHYLQQQVVWLLIGAAGAGFLYKRDYRLLEKYALFIFIATLILLILVLIPGIGSKINGSRRWLRLGPMSLQPSEIAKLGLLVGLAAWMSFIQNQAPQWKRTFLYPMAGLGGTALLVLMEPDFGTTVLLGLSGMAVLFAGGTNILLLLGTAVVGGTGLGLAIMADDVRRERILAFLDPVAHPEAAFHLIQSKTAFIRGHWFGVGLGNSIQKHQYLPEAHTDFILAIFGEELGFVSVIGVMLLFVIILFCGIRIAMRAPDRFGSLLAFGITILIATQAAINVAVVTGAMPTKGLPLPFISYGGSSMLISLACVGILLNIAAHVPPEDETQTRHAAGRAQRL